MVCQALRNYGIQAPIDVHLMVKPVDRLIPDFAKAGASLITFHPECSEHVDRTLQLIKDQGSRPVWSSIRRRRCTIWTMCWIARCDPADVGQSRLRWPEFHSGYPRQAAPGASV
jgi:hypothetical protein